MSPNVTRDGQEKRGWDTPDLGDRDTETSHQYQRRRDHRHREHRHGEHRHRKHHGEHRHREHRHREHGDRDDRRHSHRHRSPVRDAPLQRDDWMLSADGGRGAFTTLEREQRLKPEPSTQVSSRELNPQLVPELAHTTSQSGKEFGAPGYKWRMMKLERTYEMAEQRGVPVEQVALERYGSMDVFNDARAERQYLDDQKRDAKSTQKTPGRYSASTSGAFQKPGERPKAPPQPSAPRRVMGPLPAPSVLHAASGSAPKLSVSELNKLEAQALRAELTNQPEAAELREKLEQARQDADETRVEVVPTLDGLGRVYDVGTSTFAEAEEQAANMRQSKRPKFESEGDSSSLAELVRQERFSAGRADQKDADTMLAQQIAGDRAFENDTDYMDDEAQRFARKRMRDDAMKRQFAVEDFARTKRALDECPFCRQDDGRTPPRATIISSGSCVYLALPDREPLADGHCWIVPMQHHVSSLDLDEDGWTEIRVRAEMLTAELYEVFTSHGHFTQSVDGVL